MRISDWSSDVCSSDLRADVTEIAVQPIARGSLAGAAAHDVDHVAVLHRGVQGHHPAVHFRADRLVAERSEGRRVGKECVSPRRSRWSTSHTKNKTKNKN